MNTAQRIKEAREVFIFNRHSGNSVETSISLTGHALGLKSKTIRKWYEAGHFDISETEQAAIIEDWQSVRDRLEDEGAGDAAEAAWERVNR